MKKYLEKKCSVCGEVFNNQTKGMTMNVWERRRFCSRTCGGAGRGIILEEKQQRVKTRINTKTPLFYFVSGQSFLDVCQNNPEM